MARKCYSEAASDIKYSGQPYQNRVMKSLVLELMQGKAKTPYKLCFYQGQPNKFLICIKWEYLSSHQTLE